MRFALLAVGVLFASPALAAVVEPNCENYPAAEHNPAGRDRAVVLFHYACGMPLSQECNFRSNPGLLADKEGLKDCMDGGAGGGKPGRIAGHVLQWEINHGCEGNAKCTALHKELCLGRGDKLQLRRRLLRCSKKGRDKLNGMSAQLLTGKTGTNAQGQQDEHSHKFGASLLENIAAIEAGEAGR